MASAKVVPSAEVDKQPPSVAERATPKDDKDDSSGGDWQSEALDGEKFRPMDEGSLKKLYSDRDLQKKMKPATPPPEFPDLPVTVDNIGRVWLTHALRSVGILPPSVEVLTLVNKDILFSGNNSTVCIYFAEYTQDSANYPRTLCAKIMPAEGIVPGWLLKRFWRTEVEYYTKMPHPDGIRAPACYFAAFGGLRGTRSC